MEHNVYVFPPFALVRPLLRYFLDQCPSVSLLPPLSQILQAMAVDSYLLGRKGDPAVLLFPSRTCPDFIASILDKSPGQYCNIFLLFLGSLLKQCRVFEIFLQFSLPHPIQSWNSEKKSGYTRPTLFVGWGEGLDLCELENAPEMQKCPKTFVHDCLIKRWEEKRQFWGVFKPVKVFFRDPDERS